jgi:hypothetical protein
MRRVFPLLLVAVILSACSISFGPQRTPEESYRLKVAEFKTQVDALSMRIIIGMTDHKLGNVPSKWDDVPVAAAEFQALLVDAAKIEPPIIYRKAHGHMTNAIAAFELAMHRLTQFVETGRDDRYNDFTNQMRSGNAALKSLVAAVPAPD